MPEDDFERLLKSGRIKCDNSQKVNLVYFTTHPANRHDIKSSQQGFGTVDIVPSPRLFISEHGPEETGKTDDNSGEVP